MMRLKLSAIFCLLLLLSSLALAQDDGGKPLPGEGETPTVTPTPIESTDATATATLAEPDAATPSSTSAAPTEAPTNEANTDAPEFPAEMLADAEITIETGELVFTDSFDEEGDWQLEDNRDGVTEIADGVFRLQSDFNDNIPFAGKNTEEYENVLIQVTTDVLSREADNGYGLICRGDPDNALDGYHFWISADGFATIFKYEDEEFETLTAWSETGDINLGRDTNTISVLCSGEYLALFVNGVLAVDAEDDAFSEGTVGFSAVTFVEDTDVEISYDDLSVWEVDEFVPESPEVTIDTDFDEDAAAEEVIDALEQGDTAIEIGDIIFSDDFSEEGAWYSTGGDMGREVDSGVYRFDGFGENLFFWAYNEDEDQHDDVVIRVDAALSGDDTEYGLMCRSTTDADGYNFLVSSTGAYIISRWIGSDYEVLADGESDAINTGEAVNTIYAVCVGEYLALYINGELVDETDDDEYDEGITNLAVMARNEDDLIVDFDNLYVWEAND